MSYNSFRNDNNGAGEFALIQFRKSNNFASVAALDLLGQVLWSGYDAGTSTYKSASYIYCQAVGAPAANVPSELQFNTSFGTGTQLAMTIGQNGQVSISDPAANETTLVVVNNQTSPNINLRTANATATNSPHVHFTRSRAGTADVQASDDIGRLEFRGFQGGTAIEAADIRAQAQTVNGASVSGSLQFRTRPTTFAAIATRMTVSADGNVTISAPVSGDALTATAVAGSLAASFAGSNAGGVSVTQANGGAGSYQAVQSSVDAQPVYFNAFKNRAGGIIVANDVIYQLNGTGFADTNRTAALYRIFSTNVGANYVSGGHDWWTTSTAGTTGQRMVLDADGLVTINAPAVTGQALTVNGFAGTANYAFVSQASVSAGLYQSSSFINTNTTAGSGCRVDVTVSQQPITTGGDTFVRYINSGVQAISTGLNTATQQYVMASGSTLAIPSSFFTYTIANNQINLPLQASFNAYSGADQLNVTGAGAAYTVQFNTERFDVANGYNPATGVYTAPAAGKYMFYAQVRVDNITAAMTGGLMQFVVNGGVFSQNDIKSPFASGFLGIVSSFQGTIIANLAAADTVYVQIQISNGAGDTADILTTVSTYFCGQLLS